MANTKVQQHKLKVSKTYSIEKRVIEDLHTVAQEQGTSPSVIVNGLIKKFNADNLK